MIPARMQKKRILVCCDYYLPGFKSGGGMLTVANLVERFGDVYDFFVFTRNHDGPNDRTNRWERASPERSLRRLAKLMGARNSVQIVSAIR